jgi:pimeloyl-ACP methyl ester carboxylesterase
MTSKKKSGAKKGRRKTKKKGRRRLDSTFNFSLNVVNDIPDLRDRMYEPFLAPLKRRIEAPANSTILDQRTEGACTGFGLAAVINFQSRRQGSGANPAGTKGVSARMLYEMARRFDEWPGDEYSGSSCRGAIKGWYNMGVCRETSWPYVDREPGSLTVDIAKEARRISIGAYYRVRPIVVDYHAALNEVGAIYASADVHDGWMKPVDGKVVMQKKIIGGHAFAIVGYDEAGFFVQNSWGTSWGERGIAHWSYEDWQANVKDAWVVQLALPTPQIFPGFARSALEAKADKPETAPRRTDIMGHFVHLDDGRFHDKGTYFSNLPDVEETARLVAASEKYDHLLLYAHGGLNGPDASAKRICAMKETFKSNRIYPYHFMYDTGLGEELKDVLFGKKRETEKRMEGITDWSDRFIENRMRRTGRALWREMKQGARSPFAAEDSDGSLVLKAFLDAFADGDAPKKIHLAGHSTGGILMAWLWTRLNALDSSLKLGTVSLLAPAATVDDYKTLYRPLLPKARNMTVYNLSADLEKDDQVAAIYRKSLLYLVSRAFEEEDETPILGMQIYNKRLNDVDFVYSLGDPAKNKRSASTAHGGFDNDLATMNDLLRRVLGKSPTVPFTKASLDY